MSQLFSPYKLRELVFRNRIFVSPMCQYSCDDGLATESGWPVFFRILRLYLTHFRGQSCSAFRATAMVPGPQSKVWGTLTGSVLPFVLRRLGFDPAASSAPFVATLVDVTGLVIYFSVAVVVLKT